MPSFFVVSLLAQRWLPLSFRYRFVIVPMPIMHALCRLNIIKNTIKNMEQKLKVQATKTEKG